MCGLHKCVHVGECNRGRECISVGYMNAYVRENAIECDRVTGSKREEKVLSYVGNAETEKEDINS